VAGASMFVSGLILIGLMSSFFYESHILLLDTSSFQQRPLIINLIILILFSLLPFIGSLSYSTGLSRIGASVTAVIGSASILITISIQIVLRELGFKVNLPDNLFIAILGGVLGFLGIYIIHIK
jgi:uncharacterized membrane protein